MRCVWPKLSSQRNLYSDLALKVVLADGSIVDANETTNPRLYKALRGGSNNFGIVTRFDLYTLDQAQMWGGLVVYPGHSTVPTQLQRFVEFGNNIVHDQYASLIQIFTWALFNASAAVGGYANDQRSILGIFDYMKPVENPAPFKDLLEIGPTAVNHLRLTTQQDITNELNTAPNVR